MKKVEKKSAQKELNLNKEKEVKPKKILSKLKKVKKNITSGIAFVQATFISLANH